MPSVYDIFDSNEKKADFHFFSDLKYLPVGLPTAVPGVRGLTAAPFSLTFKPLRALPWLGSTSLKNIKKSVPVFYRNGFFKNVRSFPPFYR